MHSLIAITVALFVLFASAISAASVVTLGFAQDGSDSYVIYTLDVAGTVTNAAPINYSLFNNPSVYYVIDSSKNFLYLMNPWDNNCANCLYTFDITHGGAPLKTESMLLPWPCIQPSSFTMDAEHNLMFFTCQSLLVIKNGQNYERFSLPSASVKHTVYDKHTDSVYITGSECVYQYNVAKNSSKTYLIPPTDRIQLSNVVGSTSGQIYIAGQYWNANQQVYDMQWFTIGTSQSNWLVPIKGTQLAKVEVHGKSAFDASTQSIVWLSPTFMYKLNTSTGQITGNAITYKSTFVGWISSLGIYSLN